MLFRKKRNIVKAMILGAFPQSLCEDVAVVWDAIRPCLFPDVEAPGYNTRRQMLPFVLPDGETVAVPDRLLIRDTCGGAELTPVQQTILHCLYSRSTDGFVRERHIRRVLAGDIPPWAFPYVLRLCDEYLIEIVEAIYEGIKDRDNADLQAFCRQNLSYFVYSHARMISYWDYYYRARCYRYDDYVGKKLYHECFGYSRGLEKLADRSGSAKYKLYNINGIT